MAKKKRSQEAAFGTNNVMSDGMNPPIAADELVNEKIRALSPDPGRKIPQKTD